MKPNDKAYAAARKVAYNRINKCFVFDLIKEALDAAYAAQFQSEDYAELIETLRSSSPYTLSHVAADVLEAVLAERDALKAELAKAQEITRMQAERIGWYINEQEKRDAVLKPRTSLAEAAAKERDALLARLAPEDDEALVEIALEKFRRVYNDTHVIKEAQQRTSLAAAIAAIRPHIEAAALSDIVEFSKRKNWELAYRTPSYSGDPDQKEYWVVWERAGIDQDREWDAIGKGETAAEAIAATIRSGK